MTKAQQLIKEVREAAVSGNPMPAKRILNFISESDTIQDNMAEIVKLLSEHGFGTDDDDSHFDVVTMVKSALKDLIELRKENDALQSKIRDSKVFEKELMEG